MMKDLLLLCLASLVGCGDAWQLLAATSFKQPDHDPVRPMENNHEGKACCCPPIFTRRQAAVAVGTFSFATLQNPWIGKTLEESNSLSESGLVSTYQISSLLRSVPTFTM